MRLPTDEPGIYRLVLSVSLRLLSHFTRFSEVLFGAIIGAGQSQIRVCRRVAGYSRGEGQFEWDGMSRYFPPPIERKRLEIVEFIWREGLTAPGVETVSADRQLQQIQDLLRLLSCFPADEWFTHDEAKGEWRSRRYPRPTVGFNTAWSWATSLGLLEVDRTRRQAGGGTRLTAPARELLALLD